MTERPYPGGIDCLWLATDRNGHCGAFVTGGEGPVPVQLLLDVGIQVEDIGALVCYLPVSTSARMLVSMKRPDDFMDLATRGFFVYDWSDVHRVSSKCIHAYEPIAVPVNPITLDKLPDALVEIAKTAKFSDVEFADSQLLDVREHASCRDGTKLD